MTKAPFSIQRRKVPSGGLISKLTLNLVPRSPVPGGERPKMGRCTKTGFFSYKERGFEWNVLSRSQRTHSELVKPQFWTQVPRTRGYKAQIGTKWVGVLKLVSLHT